MWIVVEVSTAFAAILGVAILIYLLSRVKASKSPPAEEKNSMYFCGEKVILRNLNISITFYEYLIYFVLLDSSALIIALAATEVEAANPIFLIGYSLLMLIATLTLSRGAQQ